MNDRGLSRTLGLDRLHLTIATVVGILVAVVIGLYAVGMGGNPLKSLMLITGGSLLMVSTLNPRLGLRLLILSGAYLDFLKRFLLLFGMGSMSDVLGVLAVAPINLAGVFLGACVLRPIFTKQMLNKQERRLALFSLVLIAAALFSGIRNSGGISPVAFGNAANRAAYSLLVPIICVLYLRRDADEMKRLLQFTVFVYLPVAIYGIHQFTFGFNQFEVDYLRSGLTSLGGMLYEEHPRPFSMLSSNHAFAVSMGILFVISSLLCAGRLRNRTGIFSSKGRWVIPAIFAFACLISFGRAAWVVSIISFICIFAFRTRRRIVAFYAFFLLGFSVLVWKADVIYASLDKLQTMLPIDTAIQEQAFHIGTYSERLYGFQNIFRNRSMWTWFGNPQLAYSPGETLGRDESVHDALGQLVVTQGIAGLLVLIVGGGLSLFILHRRILAIRQGPGELLARGLMGACMGLFFGGMLTGSHLSVFPINLLFWTIAGVLVAIVLMKSAPAAEKLSVGPVGSPPRRPVPVPRLD